MTSSAPVVFYRDFEFREYISRLIVSCCEIFGSELDILRETCYRAFIV
jgi:hypothetical protein